MEPQRSVTHIHHSTAFAMFTTICICLLSLWFQVTVACPSNCDSCISSVCVNCTDSYYLYNNFTTSTQQSISTSMNPPFDSSTSSIATSSIATSSVDTSSIDTSSIATSGNTTPNTGTSKTFSVTDTSSLMTGTTSHSAFKPGTTQQMCYRCDSAVPHCTKCYYTATTNNVTCTKCNTGTLLPAGTCPADDSSLCRDPDGSVSVVCIAVPAAVGGFLLVLVVVVVVVAVVCCKKRRQPTTSKQLPSKDILDDNSGTPRYTPQPGGASSRPDKIDSVHYDVTTHAVTSTFTDVSDNRNKRDTARSNVSTQDDDPNELYMNTSGTVHNSNTAGNDDDEELYMNNPKEDMQKKKARRQQQQQQQHGPQRTTAAQSQQWQPAESQSWQPAASQSWQPEPEEDDSIYTNNLTSRRQLVAEVEGETGEIYSNEAEIQAASENIVADAEEEPDNIYGNKEMIQQALHGSSVNTSGGSHFPVAATGGDDNDNDDDDDDDKHDYVNSAMALAAYKNSVGK